MAEAPDFKYDFREDEVRKSMTAPDDDVVWRRTNIDRLLREEWNFNNNTDRREFEDYMKKHPSRKGLLNHELQQEFFRDEIEKKKS